MCKNVMKWENPKKFVMIVSQEQTGFFLETLDIFTDMPVHFLVRIKRLLT